MTVPFSLWVGCSGLRPGLTSFGLTSFGLTSFGLTSFGLTSFGQVVAPIVDGPCPGSDPRHGGSPAFRAYTEVSTATGPLVGGLVLDRAILSIHPADEPGASR